MGRYEKVFHFITILYQMIQMKIISIIYMYYIISKW